MSLEAYLDAFPRLADSVFVHGSAQVIGDVEIGEDSSIWCQAVLRGDVNHIRIGRASNIQDLAMCHVSHRTPARPLGSPLVIGDHVTVAHAVILHGCTIGNDCLIGMGSIVMDDVLVPDRVMIGAGSLVPPGKQLQSGMLYMGRPAQAVRPLTDGELEHLRYSAEHYVRVKNNHLSTASRHSPR
jgi:carbonic anhydrase/acetyltransferase-like protein (isoleucine patch superfamily)